MEKADQPQKRGRGRPEGSTSRLAREAREQAKLTGQLPHEILLDMARGNPQPIKTAEVNEATGEIEIKVVKWEIPDMEQRRDAAKAAAPYYAPKISTVEVISGVSDHDLDSIIAQLASEAGVSLGSLGEAEEGEEEEGSSAPTETGGGERSSGGDAVIRRRPVSRPQS